MTLATFLVLFALLMAGLNAGTDPDLGASAGAPRLAGSHGAGAVTVRPRAAAATDAAANAPDRPTVRNVSRGV